MLHLCQGVEEKSRLFFTDKEQGPAREAVKEQISNTTLIKRMTQRGEIRGHKLGLMIGHRCSTWRHSQRMQTRKRKSVG